MTTPMQTGLVDFFSTLTYIPLLRLRILKRKNLPNLFLFLTLIPTLALTLTLN